MSNKREEKSFFKSLCYVFFLFLSMLAVGFASYKGVFWYCGYASVQNKTIGLGKKESKIYTAILFEDSNSNKIEGAMVRIFKPQFNTVDFLVIPSNTKLSSNGEVYKGLKDSGKSLHDVMTLYTIGSADLPKEEKYDLTVKAMQELLHLDKLSGYEVYDASFLSKGLELLENQNKQIQFDVPMTVWVEDTNGEKVVINQGVQFLDGEKANGILFFNQYQNGAIDQVKLMAQFLSQFYQKIGAMEKSKKQEVYKTLYETIKSNQKASTQEKLAEYFSNTTDNSYYFHLIFGYDTKDTFEIKKEFEEKNRELIQQIEEKQDEYRKKQDMVDFEVEPVKLSTNLGIMIYNGTRISGLASEWKLKLERNGYSNIIGVGNENAIVQEETTIYAKVDGVGYDLYAYFPKAKFVVDPNLDGMDIKIVIGRLDSERE